MHMFTDTTIYRIVLDLNSLLISYYNDTWRSSHSMNTHNMLITTTILITGLIVCSNTTLQDKTVAQFKHFYKTTYYTGRQHACNSSKYCPITISHHTVKYLFQKILTNIKSCIHFVQRIYNMIRREMMTLYCVISIIVTLTENID